MIEEATKKDLNKIVELKLKMFKEAGPDNDLPSNIYDNILNHYTDLNENDRIKHFCYKENNEIIACAGGFIKDDIPYCFFEPYYYGFIGDVYTVKEYRNIGYATKLTNKVIEWLKSKEVKTIRLLASEKGKSIYKKMGFKNTDEMYFEV